MFIFFYTMKMKISNNKENTLIKKYLLIIYAHLKSINHVYRTTTNLFEEPTTTMMDTHF